jgi:hypothetical protein
MGNAANFYIKCPASEVGADDGAGTLKGSSSWTLSLRDCPFLSGLNIPVPCMSLSTRGRKLIGIEKEDKYPEFWFG